ncbi:MAG: hypothetical protein MUE54_05635 [Anaerolineae bacterium]|nr:hypothetical protein [Anaerolineae bacterium]
MKIRLLGAFCALFFIIFVIDPLYAQTAPRIVPNTPVEGEITFPNEERVWTFTGGLNMAVSLRVVPNGDFDPLLMVFDASGQELIRNDDYDYPNRRDALLEAITLPRLGEYQVVVTGYGGDIGSFTLTMQIGYADFALDERFTSLGEWESDNVVSADAVDGILTMQVTGIAQVGRVFNRQMTRQKDFYAHMTISNITGRNGWTVGMTFREQANGNRYVMLVNSSGEWRLTLWQNDTQTILRDWTTHPAIVAGDTTFTVGVLAKDVSLDIFYENQMLASITDDSIQNAGTIGVQVQTANALDSQISVQVDGIQITIPTSLNERFIIPSQLMAGNSILVSHELERRHLIPAGGTLAWEVADSFIEASRPGVDRLPLIVDTRFTNFVLSATVSASFIGEGIGACALLFQHADEQNYTVAYLDNVGGYGVSVRNGSTFSDGIFGTNESWTVANSSQLLVVVNEGMLYYYVNYILVGQMPVANITGQVGNAVLNFDPLRTNCQFRNTWVWRWE